MTIYLDNLGIECYGNFTMQNLKVAKSEIEAKIKILVEELEVINRALNIQEKYGKNGKDSGHEKNATSITRGSFLDSDEIEAAILSINGNFKLKDIEEAASSMFSNKRVSRNAISTVLLKLIGEKKLEYVRERSGRTPAIYCKMAIRTRK